MTNTTVFKNTDVAELEELCAFLNELGVDGLLLSPGYHYESVTEDIFLTRQEIQKKFQRVLELSKEYFDSNTNLPQRSFLRSQMGISAVVVYHVSSTFHIAADYFRADARWWLGEEQVVHGFNLGSTVTW